MEIKAYKNDKLVFKGKLDEFFMDNMDYDIKREYYIDMLNDCYKPVELPNGCVIEMGEVFSKFCEPQEFDNGIEEYAMNYYDDLVYELEIYGGVSFMGYDIEEVKVEE